jgi:hypothetical protein
MIPLSVSLSHFGYSSKIPVQARLAALLRAAKKYGHMSVSTRLTYVIRRTKDPKTKLIFQSDRDVVRKFFKRVK